MKKSIPFIAFIIIISLFACVYIVRVHEGVMQQQVEKAAVAATDSVAAIDLASDH